MLVHNFHLSERVPTDRHNRYSYVHAISVHGAERIRRKIVQFQLAIAVACAVCVHCPPGRGSERSVCVCVRVYVENVGVNVCVVVRARMCCNSFAVQWRS